MPAKQAERGALADSNIKDITSKAIYTSRMNDLLVPPKVEIKFPQVNFQKLVYPRIQSKVLEVKQKDLLFSITHGLYRNRARLFLQNRTDDNICPNQACKRENLVQDISHLFCTCYKVRAAWQWTRRKLLQMLTFPGRPPDISDSDFIMAMFPRSRHEDECIFLVGTFVELVDREVMSKEKDLLVNTVIGVLKARTEYARSRSVPQVNIPLP